MNAAARLAGLHQAMDGIGALLERGEIDAMPAMLDAYDQEVGAFCRLQGAGQLQQEVQALHARQLEVIALMRVHQARLQDLIRRQRQSSRAAHAYADAGAGAG